MLNCVDLFTGIGGFALALKGVSRPIVYCDSDPRVRQLLSLNMSRGKLDQAPIVHDVLDIAAIRRAVDGKQVHMVTAGFPCVGFSLRGRREGLADERSALIYAAIDIVTVLKPGMVFLENVSEILTSNGGKDMNNIRAAMTAAGYSMAWTTCSARDVGAPHLRRRWFCLCVRRGYHPPVLTANSEHSWGAPPALIAPDAGLATSTRHYMLGNSLVPLCARLSFFRLFTGFTILAVADLKGQRVRHSTKLPAGTDAPAKGRCAHAISNKNAVTCFTGSLPMLRTSADIVIDPAHFKTRKVYVENTSRPRRSPPITGAVTLDTWPTPRTGGITHSHNLSERTVWDLSTVAMYARSVGGKKLASTRDGQRMNPRFVEWLMGYPLDWTKS